MLDLLLVSPTALPAGDPDAERILRRVEGLARWRGATLLSPFTPAGPLLTTAARHLQVAIPGNATWDQRLVATLAALQAELVRLRPRVVHAFDVHLLPPVLEHTWRGVQVVVEPGLTAAQRLREADARLSSRHLVDLAGREDQLLAQATAVIARSPTEATALFKRGVSRDRLWTLPDGPLPTPDVPLPDLPHLAYVGEIDDKSGWSVVLDALTRVDGPWRLTAFIGDGRARAEAQVKAHRLDARVSFARVEADLATRLATARLLVCPARAVASLRAGAWIPAAISWARSLGRPVLAPDLSVLEDAAGPGFVGFPPDDPAALAAALDRLLRHPTELARLGGAAADHRRGWSWESTDAALRSLWTRMLSDR